MSDIEPAIGERKRVGPEDEAREDQMEDDGLGAADEDEDRLGIPDENVNAIERLAGSLRKEDI